MNRRILVTAACLGLLTAGAAMARDFADTIVSQLRAQGYSEVTVTSTWLNRTRIFAQSRDAEREIILNPRTGEILRDLYTGSGSDARIYDDSDNSGRRGGDDDDDDDDDDEDHSGHGGGGDNDGDGDGDNSGSGGGGDND
jgi:hypothetical protein